jgi:DNA primase
MIAAGLVAGATVACIRHAQAQVQGPIPRATTAVIAVLWSVFAVVDTAAFLWEIPAAAMTAVHIACAVPLFHYMRAAALDIRGKLDDLSLPNFVKPSGGKGYHVLVPLKPSADWEAVKTFSHDFAKALEQAAPHRYTATLSKKARTGKIFVDYLRNSLEQTAVAAYSTRARAGAPVSVPVTWEELSKTKGGSQYTVLNLAKRLSSLKQDPWKDIGRVKQKLPNLRTVRKS